MVFYALWWFKSNGYSLETIIWIFHFKHFSSKLLATFVVLVLLNQVFSWFGRAYVSTRVFLTSFMLVKPQFSIPHLPLCLNLTTPIFPLFCCTCTSPSFLPPGVHSCGSQFLVSLLPYVFSCLSLVLMVELPWIHRRSLRVTLLFPFLIVYEVLGL